MGSLTPRVSEAQDFFNCWLNCAKRCIVGIICTETGTLYHAAFFQPLPATMEIYKEFSFEAAHRLPNVPDGHKCGRLHGHSFRVQVHVAGPLDPKLGWVMDYADIKTVVKPVIARLDHYYLNDIPGLDNPTSEVIAEWLWRELKPLLPQLSRIVINETCTSGCVFSGS